MHTPKGSQEIWKGKWNFPLPSPKNIYNLIKVSPRKAQLIHTHMCGFLGSSLSAAVVLFASVLVLAHTSPADWVAARTWRHKSHKCAWHIVLNVNICTFNLHADSDIKGLASLSPFVTKKKWPFGGAIIWAFLALPAISNELHLKFLCILFGKFVTQLIFCVLRHLLDNKELQNC